MNPVLSGLPGGAAPASADAPLAAAELLSGDALAAQADGTTFVIDAEQLLAQPLIDAELLTEEAPRAPEAELPAVSDAPEEPGSEAEQWLASMFGQLQAQVQVREVPRSGAAQAPEPSEVVAQPAMPTLRGSAAGEERAVPRLEPQPELVSQANATRPAQADDIGIAALLHKAEASAVEPVRGAPPPAVAALTMVSGGAAPVAAAATAAPAERTLSLTQVPQAQWGERMIGALRDSVELQFRNGLQQATIRLDPAELGRVEIQLSHESGRLQVQIQAGQADVVRLLQQTSERLRQDLVGQTFVDVSVQVGADAQHDRRGRQAPPAWINESPTQAAQLDEDHGAETKGSRSDVLITV